jgi:hypothetical protein
VDGLRVWQTDERGQLTFYAPWIRSSAKAPPLWVTVPFARLSSFYESTLLARIEILIPLSFEVSPAKEQPGNVTGAFCQRQQSTLL